MSAHYSRPLVLRDIPRNRHAVIEAAAGTGKTFTIEHLVVELLLCERVRIEQILVLTFTERAAAELRRRIQAKIEQVLREPCTAANCDHDRKDGVWWIDDEARAKLRAALSDFDAASIGTIHGFFGQVLAENAFHCGRLFQGTLEDGLTLFDRAFKRALRRSLAVRPGAAAELLGLWMQEEASDDAVAHLAEVLHRCYSSRSELLPRVSLDDLRREIDANPLFGVDSPPEPTRFEAALKAAKVHHSTAKAIANRYGTLIDMIQRSGPGLQTLLAHNFQETLLKIEKLDDRPLPDPQVAQIARGLLHLKQVGGVSLEAALVQEGLPIALDFLRRHQAATGEFDYEDLITGVERALAGPGASELIASLRRRYRFALIDEFQDTDEIQWSFFRRVFVDSGGSHRVYLVGDPKQAIYGFRGADVFTYLSARATIEEAGSPRVPLSQSFRSTAELIDAYNLIFDPSAELPFFEGAIQYDQRVEPGRRDLGAVQEGAATAPIHLLKILPRGDQLGLPELRRRLAQAIARQARALLRDGPPLEFGPAGRLHPVRPRDVYVLIARNSDGLYISQALRDQNIPFSFYKQDGLFQTDEAREVRDLLAAIDEPTDPRRRGRAWITRFFDVPLAALLELQDLPESDPLVKRLVEWNEPARHRRFEALFCRILDESGVVRRELFRDDSERAISNYLHLFEILLEEARSTGCELADLVTTLTAYIQGARKPPGEDTDVQRLESDRDAVQIMTIHKSKGLEAAVVFVFGGFTAFKSRGAFEYHDDHGQRTLYIGDDPAAKEAWRREQDQEQERLYYVALTRAKARLYLPMVPAEFWSKRWDGGYARVNRRLNELEETLSPAGFERLFRVISVADRPIGAGPAHEDQPAPDPDLWTPPQGLKVRAGGRDQPDDPRRLARLRRRHAGYEVTSYSRMKSAVEAEIVPLGREELDREPVQPAALAPAPMPEGALPGGTAAGTLLHEILELVPFESPAIAPDFSAWLQLQTVGEVVDAALANNGFDARCRTAAAEMAYLALTSTIPLGRGGAIPGLYTCPHNLREMEFLFPYPEKSHPALSETSSAELVIERGFIKGYVDLVVAHGGLVYFADWKSDVLTSYEPDLLREHVASHYGLQAKLYALALVKALGAHSQADYDARFGGLVYVFLRGLKAAGTEEPPVYFERPSWAEILEYELQVKRFDPAARGGPP
jgi:exodeoxyribonuclease V beta subunit